MQTLVESKVCTLRSLTIDRERAWFEGGRDGCIDLLVYLIARQPELTFLNLGDSLITVEHQLHQQIRDAVVNPDCRVLTTIEEYLEY